MSFDLNRLLTLALLTVFIVIDVPNAETQFDIDEFNDLYSRTKPTLYIKMADIFSIHHLVAADASYVCLGNRDDILQEVIRELGNVKNNENELMGVSTSEICLTLNPKLHEAEGKRRTQNLPDLYSNEGLL